VIAEAATAAAIAFAAQAAPQELHAYRVTVAKGTETVQFAGDPAAGCADRGVCGVSGSVTFTPVRPDVGQIATVARTGHRLSGAAFTSGGTTTANVATQGADAPCTDTFFTPVAVVAFKQRAAKAQAVLHGPLGEPPLGQDAAVFATHCAGPRLSDLAQAGALPSVLFPISQLRRSIVNLRLTADTPFTASGFTGRVTADILLRLRRDRSLERALQGSGGIVVTPGSAPGSSVGA
jgi:hypothetical protein